MKGSIVALMLLQFHGPTGARIDLNAEAITSIRDPSAMPEGHWSKATRCIILVDNSPPISVSETCDEVRQAVEALKR